MTWEKKHTAYQDEEERRIYKARLAGRQPLRRRLSTNGEMLGEIDSRRLDRRLHICLRKTAVSEHDRITLNTVRLTWSQGLTMNISKVRARLTWKNAQVLILYNISCPIALFVLERQWLSYVYQVCEAWDPLHASWRLFVQICDSCNCNA